MAQLFAFFCGGSGARVAEMYTFCAAMGLTRHDIPTHICLCDADHQNGNEAASMGTINNYAAVRNEMYRRGHRAATAGSFFGTPISVGQWALDGRDADHGAGQATYKLDDLGTAGEAGMISRALFTQEERSRDIKNLGFFAHPNVGNAIVQAAILFEQDVEGDANITTEYKRTKQMIVQQLNAGENVYVVFVGSLFGGTGAACMPTIAKDLHTSIKKYCHETGTNFDVVFHMSAVMLLPYFTLPAPTDGREIVDGSVFDSSTKIAMDHYFRKHPGLFEAVYPIGLPTSYVQPGEAKYGGEKQKNPSSLVEWVAALAIQNFVATHDVNAPRPINSELYCASLDVDDQNKYVLRYSSFMNAAFATAFNRWNEFSVFYALSLYPNIKMGNEGKKVPNWYKNYIGTDMDNPAINGLFSFVRSFYSGIENLLGLQLQVNARPINELINEDMLEKVCDVLDELSAIDYMSPKDAKKAYKELRHGFEIPMDRLQRKTMPNKLESVVNSENTAAGGLGQLLQFVDNAL